MTGCAESGSERDSTAKQGTRLIVWRRRSIVRRNVATLSADTRRRCTSTGVKGGSPSGNQWEPSALRSSAWFRGNHGYRTASRRRRL